MELTPLLIFGLATWRLASLLVNEAGPGFMFLKLRERAGITHIGGEKLIIPDGFLPGLLSCIWCSSLWVGVGWALLYWLFPDAAPLIAAPFAFSTVAVLVQNCTER